MTVPVEDPHVTVLTPVYNGARYLPACIESVLAQTYRSWSYVIVDNCSTDGSLEIAQRYARQDPRIRVVSNERFVDVLVNHNIAFRLVGEDSRYCKVVHADDWLFPDCLRRMIEVAEAHPSVGIVGAYRLDDARVGCDGLPYPSTVVPGRVLGRLRLLGGPGVFGSLTSVLIRADQVRRRDPFLDEADFHSDTSVCYEIVSEADFGFVHQVLTFTRRHAEAQTSRAERVNTYQASQLGRLLRYGPVFLSQDEYERRKEEVLGQYYRFLARRLLEPRPGEAWSYHRQALKAMGHPMRWRSLAGALLPYWPRVLAQPFAVLRLATRVLVLLRTGRVRGRGRKGPGADGMLPPGGPLHHEGVPKAGVRTPTGA